MHNTRKSIHRFTVHQDFQFNQIIRAIRTVLVVHGPIPASNALNAITKIDQDLAQRDLRRKHDPFCIQGIGLGHLASFFPNHCHQITDVLVGTKQKYSHHGFSDLFDHAGIRELNRIFNRKDFSTGQSDLVDHAWVGRKNFHSKFSGEPLLDDLHM